MEELLVTIGLVRYMQDHQAILSISYFIKVCANFQPSGVL